MSILLTCGVIVDFSALGFIFRFLDEQSQIVQEWQEIVDERSSSSELGSKVLKTSALTYCIVVLFCLPRAKQQTHVTTIASPWHKQWNMEEKKDICSRSMCRIMRSCVPGAKTIHQWTDPQPARHELISIQECQTMPQVLAIYDAGPTWSAEKADIRCNLSGKISATITLTVLLREVFTLWMPDETHGAH